MTDGVGALGLRDFDDALGDDRARKRRAEQVIALINGARLQRRVNKVLDKLLFKVFNIKLRRARLDRFLFKTVEPVPCPTSPETAITSQLL